MTITIDNVFRDAIEMAISELVSASHRPEGSYVRTPLLYPSGSEVVVRVSGTPSQFFVTDFGMGYTEADLMGHSLSYARHARAIGQAAGIGFDEHAFFVIKVGLDNLPGAISSVANVSQEAVAQTAFRAAEKATADGTEAMIETLERVFGAQRTNRRARVIGASNHEWEFAALIETSQRPSVFEFSTKHPNSIASVATKMNDVARIEGAPRRIVMVRNKPELATYLGVLSQSASVIEQNLPDQRIKHLAEAA